MDIIDKLVKTIEYMGKSHDFNESASMLYVFDAINEIKELRTKLAEREWISVADRLPTINEKGNWHISQRCVVIVNKGHEKYEAFANLTEYLDLGAEWSIDGHNGNWHKNVTHWMPLPPINASPNEG